MVDKCKKAHEAGDKWSSISLSGKQLKFQGWGRRVRVKIFRCYGLRKISKAVSSRDDSGTLEASQNR